MELHEEFKIYENMWEEVPVEAAPQDVEKANALEVVFNGKTYDLRILESVKEWFRDEIRTNGAICVAEKLIEGLIAMNVSTDEVVIKYLQGWVDKKTPMMFGDITFYTDSKINESLAESDDPYGYGPYKTFSDPNLSVGDYVLATRPFSRDDKTYPAKIIDISSNWIDYEISGFGFTERGTKARPSSKSAGILHNAKNYINNLK